MKRLIICCDGTWNGITMEHATNVLQLARAIPKIDDNGIHQIVHYSEGVGSGNGSSGVARWVDRLGGGAFGWGLTGNVEACYRFLVFNYEPGDEIYIFGFSRGAYTARSLGGMIRTCSIMMSEQIRYLPEAFALYRKRDQKGGPDTQELMEFRARHAPHLIVSDAEEKWRKDNLPAEVPAMAQRLTITYLGIWDTVGALGIPDTLMISGLFNGKYKFHDTDLSRGVRAARHALAIDEKRKSFEPTGWDNLDELNNAAIANGAMLRPYLQEWFPGTHGAVGGGGESRALSAEALRWVVEGARHMGLQCEPRLDQAIELERSPLGTIENGVKKASLFGSINKLIGLRDRQGPEKVENVSDYARKRWQAKAEELPDRQSYRPKTLEKVSDALNSWLPGT